jgi:spore coat polysaccharide biosynthesis predicted glycosyltransferase SpsG
VAADVVLEIRADGGKRLGFGHLGRCLALAEAVGDGARFCVEDPDASAFVVGRGGRLQRATGSAPVVLLDQAAPTPLEAVRKLRSAGTRVVLLDDPGGGRMESELVIDPPTGASWPPSGGNRLAGFEHVLIRAELRSVTRSSRSAGVLVAMGGSDPHGATVPLAEALVAAGVAVSVVLGPGYSGGVPRGVHDVVRPDGFTAAFSRCAVLVAAYGQVLLEACYLGVPAIAVVLTADQLINASTFCAHGTALMVDGSHGTAAGGLLRAVARLTDHPEAGRALAERGPQLVDGLGAQRVAAAIRQLV